MCYAQCHRGTKCSYFFFTALRVPLETSLVLLCTKLLKLQLCVTKLLMDFIIKAKYSTMLKKKLALNWVLERNTCIFSWYCSCKFSSFSSLISWKLNVVVLSAGAAVGACSDSWFAASEEQNPSYSVFFICGLEYFMYYDNGQFRDAELRTKFCS